MTSLKMDLNQIKTYNKSWKLFILNLILKIFIIIEPIMNTNNPNTNNKKAIAAFDFPSNKII